MFLGSAILHFILKCDFENVLEEKNIPQWYSPDVKLPLLPNAVADVVALRFLGNAARLV